MKYLKKYENLDTSKPKIGDYVICTDLSSSNPNRSDRKAFDNFVRNNIGRVVKTSETHEYFVQYDDTSKLTDEILEYAFFTSDRMILSGIKNLKLIQKDKDILTNITSFKLSEITFHSNDKETVEIYLDSKDNINKYNL